MARRKFDIFSMSFLDTICCAFGAIVLLYMIINASSNRMFQRDTSSLRAEVDKLEQEVLEGYANLVTLTNTLQSTTKEEVTAQGQSKRVLEELTVTQQELAEYENETLSRREHINRLKAELKSLEEGTRRLEGGSQSKAPPGNKAVGFKGDGDRQYLTGLRVGGSHILVLVDASASMLDDTVVNVIRLRNMSDSRKLLSEKWQRTVASIDWLASQLPAESKFQFYAFNTQAWPLIKGSEGKWLETGDAEAINNALRGLRDTVPKDGTSLENAFAIVNGLTPKPDNVILVTDGLPTQGASPPLLAKTIDGDGRLKLFERAMGKFPRAVPLNVILMPMEGDPSAPSAWWAATRATGGAFMSPAKDWP